MNPCATNQGFQSLAVFEHEANRLVGTTGLYSIKRELIRRSSGSTFRELSAKGTPQC